jgi:hypothetical protein
MADASNDNLLVRVPHPVKDTALEAKKLLGAAQDILNFFEKSPESKRLQELKAALFLLDPATVQYGEIALQNENGLPVFVSLYNFLGRFASPTAAATAEDYAALSLQEFVADTVTDYRLAHNAHLELNRREPGEPRR